MPETTIPACPKCGTQRAARVKRNGFLQNVVLPRLDRYPWECAACRSVFTVKNRGKARVRRRSAGQDGQPSQTSLSSAAPQSSQAPQSSETAQPGAVR